MPFGMHYLFMILPFDVTGPGAHSSPYTMGTGIIPGGKAAGAWRWLSTPSTFQVEGRIELCLYFPVGPS